MKIHYYYRHPSVGYSIARVFQSLISEIGKTEEISQYYMPSPNSWPWHVIQNCFFTFRHRNRRGIHHITGHEHEIILALIGCKVVLTIHDLVFLDNVKNPIKKFYKWLFWLYLPVKLADRVTCISEQTKKNILRHLRTNKLVVIHNPIDPAFKFSSKEFNPDKPVVLHIGTGWNKNLHRTVEALKNVPCHLRIIGNISNDIRVLLENHKVEYSVISGLTDEEVRQEYIHCDMVSFPSEYEGFGMPIIEGQATGRVVVTSRLSPMEDVAGDGAFFVDPFDVASIRSGYISLIKDETLRQDLIRKGLENVKKYRAENIARQYLEVYEEVMHGNIENHKL